MTEVDGDVQAGFNMRPIRRKLGKRSNEKLSTVPPTEKIVDFSPGNNKQLPYYSSIPYQRWECSEWLKLSVRTKGTFLLICDLLWLSGGSLPLSDLPAVARKMKTDIEHLQQDIDSLIDTGFLFELEGRIFQWDLRVQQLTTINSSRKDLSLQQPDSELDTE